MLFTIDCSRLTITAVTDPQTRRWGSMFSNRSQRGWGMRVLGSFLGVVVAAFLIVVPAAAQNYPMPTKVGAPLATVDGKPLYPYSSPFVNHTGRFLDSVYVTDQHINPRTMRAHGLSVSPETGKVYARIGAHFVSWNLSTFFTQDLGKPLSSTLIRQRKDLFEQYLPWTAHVYPEEAGSGWDAYLWDGQDRLYDYAWDDRGYAYVAYAPWGWGIVEEKSLKLVRQVKESSEVITTFKASGRYYVVSSVIGFQSSVWDVTQPTNPVAVRTLPFGVNSVVTAKIGGNDVVGMVANIKGGGTEFRIYRGSDLVQGGSPVLTKKEGAQTYNVDTDGTNFYVLSAVPMSRISTLTTYTLTNASAPTFSDQSFSFSNRSWYGLRYGSGHLTAWGLDGDNVQNVRLFRLEGAVPVERDLGDFLRRHYFQSGQPDYYVPHNIETYEALYVQHGGKEYLVLSGRRLGDVFELEAPDRLSIALDGVFGTRNPNTPSTSTGIFYGDPLRFSASIPSGDVDVQWDFGNPEGLPDRNQQTIPSNQTVTYQYAGLTTTSAIQGVKTVTGTEATNSGNSATTNVTMQVPTARVRLAGTDAIIPGTALSTFGVVAGDTFVDASDGTIQSHYGEFTIDGTTVPAAPGHPVSVGACGTQELRYTARYVPYTGSGTDVEPLLPANKHFVRNLAAVSYEVRPFIPTIEVSSTSTTVVFRNKTRFKAGAFDTGALWTVEWRLLDAAGGTVVSETDVSTVGTVDTFSVAKSAIVPGYSVVMTVLVDPSALNDISCAAVEYLTAEATHALVPPDPAIMKSGCTEAKGPCELTITSESGASVSDWTISWFLDGTLATKGETYSPNLPEAGTYQIRADATNDFGEGSKSISLTVTAPSCPAPGIFSIAWTGQTSGCTGSGCTSSSETYLFEAAPWQWNLDSCHTFAWDFGDGTTSIQRTPTKKYSANGTYTIKLTVSNGSGNSASETATLTLGGGGGDPGPGPTCSAPPANSVFPSFTGRTSACSTGDPNCRQGETIDFRGDTWGYTVQSCDSFEWRFGDGRTSSLRNPSISYPTPGTYTARFTIRNSGGSASGEATINILPVQQEDPCKVKPVVMGINYLGTQSACGPNATGCLPNEEIRFSAETWQYAWQDCDAFLWEFGDGNTSTTREPRHTYTVAGDRTVRLTVSNKHGNVVVTETIVLGTPATKPTSADFTWTPSRPKPGEAVTFTGSTTGGDPATRWEWNFGGGANAQGQSVTHTFIGEGAFPVTLKAGNSGGDVQRVKTVDVKSSVTYLLPVVTHAEGAHGSAWRTDLHVYQPEFDTALPIEVELTFKGLTKKLLLDASTKIYEDLLGEITSADDAGPVFLISPVQLDMWTRTYNVSASGVGTFGQLIPAVLLDDEGAGTVIGSRTWNLGGMRYSERFRTNLGFVNPTATRADLRIHVYEEEFGVGIGSFDVSINPYALDQKALHIWYPNLKHGEGVSLRIESLNDVSIISYASVIDNLSNDPFFIGALSDSILANSSYREMLIPGVGHIGRWRSDLAIFNSDSQGVDLNIAFFDESGAKLGGAEGVRIAGKASRAVEDIVRSTLIDVEQDALGTLQITTKSDNERFPFIFSRTYSDQTAAGTFGQGIPAFAKGSPNVRPDRPAFVPGVRSDPSYYTNLGLVSVSDEVTEVVVQLLHPNSGEALTQRIYVLEPDQSKIIPRVISEFLGSEASRGTLKIIVKSGGPVWAYGSVVDKLTNDPEYVPAVPSR
jgi:PKD repeat protein